MSRHEDHGQSLAFAKQLLVELKPILPWHADIEYEAARHLGAVIPEKTDGTAETSGLKSERLQQCDEGFDEWPVIIDDKHTRNFLIPLGHCLASVQKSQRQHENGVPIRLVSRT